MLTEAEKELNRERSRVAVLNAKQSLKTGDRLRVTKCPVTKRWITFPARKGDCVVSKSGINDFSPLCVDMLNGESIDFTKAANA